MNTIGFIGLGRMGFSMALNLVRKNFRLLVYDINHDAVSRLVDAGAKAAQDITSLAQQSDIIITMLPSSIEVESVALGPLGIFANAKRGTILMDMSTINPLVTDRLQLEARQNGMSVVDAPVGRLAEHADRAESLFMVGASDLDFLRVQPLLEAMGTTIYHCGDVGCGGRTKLVNNYVAITLCQVNGEALALSQKLGLNILKTLDVLLGTSAKNGQLALNFPNKVLVGDVTPGFTIDLAHKDYSLVQIVAQSVQLSMPVAESVHESFSQARIDGYGQIDFSGIADVICERGGANKPRVPIDWRPT